MHYLYHLISNPNIIEVMKKTTLLAAMLSTAFMVSAQTEVTNYTPGIATEGAVYHLPKTAINIHVTIKNTTYTPGELYQYADRFLRITDISGKESSHYALESITLSTEGQPDAKKLYRIKFDPRSLAPFVELNEEGVLQAINTQSAKPQPDAPQSTSDKPKELNPRNYMNEEMLIAGSKAKLAELVAKEIYNIRESRNLLLRGQSESMPKDGEALQIILNQLDEQETALTQLFVGTTATTTRTETYQVIPEESVDRVVMGRFSRKLGLLRPDDLAGAPIYIDVKDLNTVPKPLPELETENQGKSKLKGKKKNTDKQEGVVYNIPGKAMVKVYTNTSTFVEERLSIAQFGNTETLSSSHFNKKSNISVQLDPATGALLRIQD